MWEGYAKVVSLVLLVALGMLLGAYARMHAHAVLPRVRKAIRGSSPQLVGAALVMLVVVLWTASSVGVQLVFERTNFRKPFFLTYACSVLFLVYLPFYPRQTAALASAACRTLRSCGLGGGGSAVYSVVGMGGPDGDGDDGDSDVSSHGGGLILSFGGGVAGTIGARAAVCLATQLGLVFFVFQLLFNIGLAMTSVSNSTILSSSAGIWTLLFSACVLGEQVTAVKCAAVLLTFIGVVTVVLHAEPTGSHHLGGSGAFFAGGATTAWGNGLTLASAVLYGGYATWLKRQVPSERALPMPFLFGLIGLVNTLLLWPLFLLLHFSSLERFAWPSRTAAGGMLINGLLGTGANPTTPRARVWTADAPECRHPTAPGCRPPAPARRSPDGR